MFTSLRIRDSFIRLNRILKKEERAIIVYFDLNNEILRLTIAFKKYNLNKRLENEEKFKKTIKDCLNKLKGLILKELSDLNNSKDNLLFLLEGDIISKDIKIILEQNHIKLNDVINEILKINETEVDRCVTSYGKQLSLLLENSDEINQKLKETFLDNDSIDIIITKLKIQGVILEAVIENFKEFKDYVKKELFKGNFVMSRRRFLRGVGETAVLSALSGSFVHSSLNLIAAYYLLLSHKLPRRNDNALAILISKDFPLSLAGELILIGYISRIELAFRFKAKIIKKDATSEDLENCLLDQKIQNIVIAGHGTYRTWRATNSVVNDVFFQKDIFFSGARYFNNTWISPYKKTGYLIKHTCGGSSSGKDAGYLREKGVIFGKPLFEEDNIFCLNRLGSALEFYIYVFPEESEYLDKFVNKAEELFKKIRS